LKFKGVISQGKRKGDIIEYSPSEKAVVALNDGITRHPLFEGYLVFSKTVEVTKVHPSTKGNPLKDLWQNNSYEAEGRATIVRRNIAKDQLLQPKEFSFQIKFEDKLQENGLPTLEIVDLKLSSI